MPSSAASGQLLFSTLAEDPDLAEIVEMFVDEMPARIETILSCFQSEDWEGLKRASHQLKGAAGSYGFPSITPCAGVLEAAVRQTRPEDEIRSAVDELVSMCRNVRAGTPA
ncbi:MAG: Hpt domain-containing protein [Thermoguttaceae bacterium]